MNAVQQFLEVTPPGQGIPRDAVTVRPADDRDNVPVGTVALVVRRATPWSNLSPALLRLYRKRRAGTLRVLLRKRAVTRTFEVIDGSCVSGNFRRLLATGTTAGAVTALVV